MFDTFKITAKQRLIVLRLMGKTCRNCKWFSQPPDFNIGFCKLNWEIVGRPKNKERTTYSET